MLNHIYHHKGVSFLKRTEKMIKIDVNSNVLTALQTEFPTPPNSAQRALKKYVKALEDSLNEALIRGRDPYDYKLKLYTISLKALANSGPQIGTQRIRLHAWLRTNGYELVTTKFKGNNISAVNSKVNPTWLVTLKDFDCRLEPKSAFEKMHPNFDKLTQQEIDTDYDVVQLDIQSIDNFIKNIAQNCKELKNYEKDIALHQARRIAAAAMYKNGLFFQKKKPSEFGRTYYHGLSAQNVNKKLRKAMLGNSWEYDMRSSVVSWKLGFAQSYIDTYTPASNIQTEFPLSYQYSIDKKPLIDQVKALVLIDSDKTDEAQNELIKEGMTALNFGARLSDVTYVNSANKTQSSAIRSIFTNQNERQRFLKCQQIVEFRTEQDKLNNFIIEKIRQSQPLLLEKEAFRTKNNRLKKNALMAYLYQHAETEVMNIVREQAKENGLTILANIHDAIVLKEQLSAELKSQIEQAMRTVTSNNYWVLNETRYQRVT